METIKKEFEIGDQVIWKHINDKDYRGRVANIDKFNENYHVYVDFGEGFHEWFTADGRWDKESDASLFHADPYWEARLSEGKLEASMPGKPGKVIIDRYADGSVCVRVYDQYGSTVDTCYYAHSYLAGEK